MAGGRPPKYDPAHHPELAKWMCRAGATNEDIANEIGIVVSTFHAWKLKHKEFSDALKGQKRFPAWQVKTALLKRALGYEEEETEVKKVRALPKKTKGKKSEPVEDMALEDMPMIVVEEKVKKIKILPEMKAIAMYLYNMCPEEFKASRTEQGGGASLTADQLKDIAESHEAAQ